MRTDEAYDAYDANFNPDLDDANEAIEAAFHAGYDAGYDTGYDDSLDDNATPSNPQYDACLLDIGGCEEDSW